MSKPLHHRETLRAQRRFFRCLKYTHGIALTSLARESGLIHSTLRTYHGRRRDEPQSMMPLAAVNAIAIALRDEWPEAVEALAILLSPGGVTIKPDPDFEIFDEEDE